jgi:hypothetical protein
LAAAQPVVEESAVLVAAEGVANPEFASPQVASMIVSPAVAKSPVVKPAIGSNRALHRKSAPADRRAKLRKARA